MSDEIGDRLTPELSDAGGPSECEGKTTSNHSEVVLRSIDDIPTEVIHPADMRSDSEFQSAPKLADRFCARAMMNSMKNRSFRREAVHYDFIPFTATKNNTAPGPDVRRKARTLNRVTKRKGSQHFPNCAFVARSFLNGGAWAKTLLDVKPGTMCVQDKSLHTNAEITAEKYLRSMPPPQAWSPPRYVSMVP